MGYSILRHALDQEIKKWEKHHLSEPITVQKWSKTLQTKINQTIPAKIHELFVTAMKGTINSVYHGDKFLEDLMKRKPVLYNSYFKKEEKARQKINEYKKIAALEGFGTGLGGFISSAADFSLLLAIKYKLLLELSRIYGYKIENRKERVYILYIFQLAFSDYRYRNKIYEIIKDFDKEINKDTEEVQWKKLQEEYRDYIDIPKLLQMIPIIGAPIGGVINYQLIEKLGTTSLHCFRVRFVNDLVLDV